MPRVDFRYLSPVLSPRRATLVDTPAERAHLLAMIRGEEATAAEQIYGLISEQGRVSAWRLPTSEMLIYEGEIELDHDGALVRDWRPAGDPRVYRVVCEDDNDEHEVIADVRRLFMAHSLRRNAARRFTGWRDRVVVLVPEEVGAKESNIMRTTAGGGVQVVHTYNVLDAYATYSSWVNDLAKEFGGTDEVLASGTAWTPTTAEEAAVRHVVQAWLMREAADAQLSQARASLKLGLAGHARLLKRSDGHQMSIAELSRSLYTDRPNLSKVVSAAEKDARLVRLLDAIESGDTDQVLAAYRDN